MHDGGDLHEQILRVETHLEELTDVVEKCRKIDLISKVALAGGGLVILATTFGVVGFNPAVMLGSIAAVIGLIGRRGISPLGVRVHDTAESCSSENYCKAAQATKARIAIPAMRNKLTTSASSWFNRRVNSSLPHRAMLGANLDMRRLRPSKPCARFRTASRRQDKLLH